MPEESGKPGLPNLAGLHIGVVICLLFSCSAQSLAFLLIPTSGSGCVERVDDQVGGVCAWPVRDDGCEFVGQAK